MRENQISRIFCWFYILYMYSCSFDYIYTLEIYSEFCVFWVMLSDFDNKLLTFYFGECKITLEGIEVIV